MTIHEKWFISDTHFFHDNILKFKNKDEKPLRPFKSIEEMHSVLVNRWNALVQPQDYVYHLGDVTFQYHRPFQELMYSLNGHKRLIVGNHDKLKQEGLIKHFDKVMLWHGFKECGFVASHMPLKEGHFRDGKFNVHGHLHNNTIDDRHYINICVERTDYRPIHIEEIVRLINENNN